jgi:hypothetical protein
MQSQYCDTSGAVTYINPVAALFQVRRTHEPDKDSARRASAFDIRTFKCAGCRHVHAATVETDPLKSGAVLRLASHDLDHQCERATPEGRTPWRNLYIAKT